MSMLQVTGDIYVKRPENCDVIDHKRNELIYELLGIPPQSGNAEKLSVAFVAISQGGSSLAHFHKKRDEGYYILEGQARVIIGQECRVLKPGDLVKIPAGTVHQIFNDHKETLTLYCTCAPSWTGDDFFPVDGPSDVSDSPERKMYVCSKEDCVVHERGRGQFIYELLGITKGDSKKMGVGHVEITSGRASLLCEQPDVELSYVILEGQGAVKAGDKSVAISAGALVKLPVGSLHEIFSAHTETLKFLYTCAPALPFEDFAKTLF